MSRFAKIRTLALGAVLALATTVAAAGPLDKAKNAVDPDCTPGKAAKGAAMNATVGIGNRCGIAETARDVTGVDDRVDGRQDDNRGGPLRRAGKD